MTIDKKTIDFAKQAYAVLKDDTSKHAAWFEFDNNGDIRLTMIKKSWYHGAWVLFDGLRHCQFSEEFLQSLQDKKEEAKP